MIDPQNCKSNHWCSRLAVIIEDCNLEKSNQVPFVKKITLLVLIQKVRMVESLREEETFN